VAPALPDIGPAVSPARPRLLIVPADAAAGASLGAGSGGSRTTSTGLKRSANGQQAHDSRADQRLRSSGLNVNMV